MDGLTPKVAYLPDTAGLGLQRDKPSTGHPQT